MTANVLPRALCMIPRNSLHCYRSNLGFSNSVSRSSPALNPIRFSCSRVSLDGFSFYKSHIGNLRSGSFVVRAEAEVEAETAAEGEANEADDGEAPEVEADAEVEEKPPRKPRVKLGDIMGILNKRARHQNRKGLHQTFELGTWSKSNWKFLKTSVDCRYTRGLSSQSKTPEYIQLSE